MQQQHRSREQRGFTLIELLAVMAILAVLVGVVAPAVTGTRDASVDAQVLQDATQVRSAASDYYGDKDEAEVRIPHTITTKCTLPVASQQRSQDTSVTTGAGETTASVTLTYALLGNSTANVVAVESSSLNDTAPVASSYDAATKELIIAGLAALTTRTLTVAYNDAPAAVAVTAQQTVSNRWPEKFISLQVDDDGASVAAPANVVDIGALYANVVPTDPADNIYDVVLTDKEGFPISGSTLLTRYTAVDIKALTDSGDLQQAPAGVGYASDGIPNFLWLFEKTSSASDRSDDNREVAVFKLVNVEKLEVTGSMTLASKKLEVTATGVVTAVAATTENKVRVTYERIF